MTLVFREPGTNEYPARDWDVVRIGGWAKICFRDSSGTDRYSSNIVNEQGLPITDDAMLASVSDGTCLRVSSGKIYVLTGERRPHPNHPQLSFLWCPEPRRRSWLARVLGGAS
jgi:hypothetical protein